MASTGFVLLLLATFAWTSSSALPYFRRSLSGGPLQAERGQFQSQAKTSETAQHSGQVRRDDIAETEHELESKTSVGEGIHNIPPVLLKTITDEALVSDANPEAHPQKSQSAEGATEGTHQRKKKEALTIQRVKTRRAAQLQEFSSISAASTPSFDNDTAQQSVDFSARVLGASLTAALGAAAANAAGAGGGGIFVPILTLLLGFDVKLATAVSKTMVLGGAIATFCFNAWLTHPTRRRPVINFDVAVLMQPMLLLGISAGILLNVVLPPWAITSLLCLVLFGITVNTVSRGMSARRKEQQEREDAAAAVAEEERTAAIAAAHAAQQKELVRLLHSIECSRSQSAYMLACAMMGKQDPLKQQALETAPPVVETPEHQPHMNLVIHAALKLGQWNSGLDDDDRIGSSQLRSIGRLESAGSFRVDSVKSLESDFHVEPPSKSPLATGFPMGSTPSERVLLPATSSSFQLLAPDASQDEQKRRIFPFLSKSDKWALAQLCLLWLAFLALQLVKSTTATCSLAYWFISVSQVPLSFGATLTASVALRRRCRNGGEIMKGCCEDEIEWTASTVMAFPLWAFLAGVMGGLLGIGGGMIMAPLLLQVGLVPQVASATSMFLVLFSSSLSVAEFSLIGRIPVLISLYFCAVAVTAALVGLTFVRSYVLRTGRSSILILLLGGVIGVSGILLGSLSVVGPHGTWNGVHDLGFQSLCSSA